MSAKDTGGPAFPREDYQLNGAGGKLGQEGMTLRDYFAAKAMQARMSDYKSMMSLVEYAEKADQVLSKVIAEQAYDMADAMLKARQA